MGLYSFYKKRQKKPRANITHHITHRQIGNKKILLHVAITISNVGDVLITLGYSETRIVRILPLSTTFSDAINQGQNLVKDDETEIQWPEVEFKKSDCKNYQLTM